MRWGCKANGGPEAASARPPSAHLLVSEDSFFTSSHWMGCPLKISAAAAVDGLASFRLSACLLQSTASATAAATSTESNRVPWRVVPPMPLCSGLSL